MTLLPLLILFIQIFIIRSEIINEPTLKAAEPFSAKTDGDVLRKEIYDDIHTNRDKLVDIWFHRTYDQRRQIQEYYDHDLCGGWSWYHSYDHCPLSTAFHQISKDSMDDLYSDSLLSPEYLLSKTINEVITGKWKEKGAIEEIMCANDKEMKNSISENFQSAYKDTVENQLSTFKKDNQDYQHVMQKYCWKGLCQEKKLKLEDVDKEAKALRSIDPEKDKEGFKKKLLDLLDNNCEPDMKMIFEKYRQDKDGIENAVAKVFTDENVGKAYNVLVRYIENTCQFYADELHRSLDKLGTDFDKINRIILTRCERDLGCISKKYKDIYGETFTNELKCNTAEFRYLKSIRYLCGKT